MRRALLIGINQYHNAPLMGCVNDITDINHILVHQYGFVQPNIVTLLDAQANTANMIHYLNHMISITMPNDELYIHYSGHGSQIPDKNNDELDGLDEILCPFDLDWKTKLISDDMLTSMLKNAHNGANIVIVLDACHSGTGTRNSLANDGSVVRYRYLPAPEFDINKELLNIMHNDKPMPKVKRFKKKNSGGDTVIIENMNHVLISGCKSTETSADAYINGRYNGALTYHLVKALRSNPNSSLKSVVDDARRMVKAARYAQTPQLEGTSQRLSKSMFIF